MAVAYALRGEDMQLVEITLEPGQSVRAEPGAMLYMDTDIEMQTSTGGGLWKGIRRALAGESLFIAAFTNRGTRPATVAFSAPFPGKIIPLDLREYNGRFLCQKDSFLCAEANVDVDIAFTKRLGAGFFGGEGFILERLEGDGLAFLHAGGTIIRRELAAGETLRLDTGCLVGFTDSVDYDIQFVGGFRNALFGGEGLFLAKLTGPGVVLLQSLPFSRLAGRIVAAAGSKREETRGIAGIGGGVLGSLLGGDTEY